MTTYYRFRTPADLAEFVNTFSRQSWNDLHIIEAGKQGIYLPVDQLEQNGLIDGPTEQGIKLVADSMEFDENQLLADQPKAKRISVKECILNTSLKSRGKGVMDEPPLRLAPDPETEHFALRPVRSGYREVLLAVKKHVADRQSEAKYLRKIVHELASMAVLSFEYAAVERVTPQTGQQSFVSDPPFSYLVRIHNLQFRSFIFRCVHDEDLGVYDVLVKGTHHQVYVSAGYEWTPVEKSINRMLEHLPSGAFFLVMAPGVREFPNRLNELEMTVCDNTQGFQQELGADRNGQERYTVTVSQWIDGLKTDRTLLSMPIEQETLGQSPQGERDLNICLRLERQGSRDHYEFRKKRLKAAIRKMQEEAVEAETMEELLGDSKHMGYVSLYAYQEPNENPYSRDMDSCLRSLLMTYPRDCLYSLLHVRVGLPDTLSAADVPGGRGEGTYRYDLVLDRSLQGREEAGLWTRAGVAEEKDYRPWPLPSEFHPGEGQVFDLENSLYNRYELTVFLPRGFMLRPYMDFKNEHKNKIVDLLCRGAGGQATIVREDPTKYILILYPKKQGTVGLVVVPKEGLAPLGERFNYFNKTLTVNENIECNPPETAQKILDAWGGQAVKSLYQKKVRGYAEEAIGTLSTLEALHRKIMKECMQYEKDCTALLDEMTATRLACEREIKKWREFVEQMQDWRQACMETVWKKMDSFAAVCEESLNALPEDAEQQHKEKVKNLMKEATERSARYQKVTAELTDRMLILLGMKRRQ